MSWVHSMWIAGALAALARGHHAMIEGHDLSKSGYHLCTANETRIVSYVVFRVAPYIVQRHCGGWLPWRMCNVTLYKITYGTEYKKVTQEVTRCCHGFIRVGSYCALPLDRSREFTTKPGLCPAAGEEPPDTCETCVWDIDCSGWQKCCETVNGSRCVDPATFSHYVANGGSSLNVTVTVKTDYHRMMASDKGLLNHTQLLLAMVNGALNSSEVSVKYLSSCPVGPYRTATSLIIGCNTTLSLDDTTANMHLLLRDVTEVSAVTVEDVDECAHPALRNCSPQAECNNTVASYHCTCRQGYTDVLPQNAGASCETDQTTTDAPACIYGPAGPPSPPAPPGPTPDGPAENPDPSQPTAAPTLSTASENLSPSYTTYTSVTPPEESSTCAPPQLTQLSSSHITDTSFYLYWSSPSPSNQTSYLVVLRYGSEAISHWETNENTLNVTGLYPGVLYNVTVTPCACDAQGESLRVNVKTAAQTLAATARVTNINFTEDFLNSSSQAYLNFSTSFKEEIYKSLSPELMELVKSGKVRIEITSVSWGSVVVNFTIVSAQNYDTLNVSDAVLSSLLNSSNYYLDENSTHFDECASGINDCSQYATCNNTWGSYTCVCNDGFEDMDSGRPGRVCGGIWSSKKTLCSFPAHHCRYRYHFLNDAHHCRYRYHFLNDAHHCRYRYHFLDDAHHCTYCYHFLDNAHRCTYRYHFLDNAHHCTYCYHFLNDAHHSTYRYHFLDDAHHCRYHFLDNAHHCNYCYHFLNDAHHCTYCYHFLNDAHHCNYHFLNDAHHCTYCYHFLNDAHHCNYHFLNDAHHCNYHFLNDAHHCNYHFLNDAHHCTYRYHFHDNAHHCRYRYCEPPH
ncbi:Uromodulin-like 1 [Merluccius polli]|uniref:Uromodulin-like 1 n=1 Tax=Merluccius polli TaxID=89951 RepID=A0AA47M1W0_MERPO|nr:Uromodulin-like 1 [Merluccius polli]